MSVLDDLLFSWLCSVTAVSNLQDSLSLSLYHLDIANLPETTMIYIFAEFGVYISEWNINSDIFIPHPLGVKFIDSV